MLDSFTHPIEGAIQPPVSIEALITEHMPLVGFAVSEIGMRLPAHVDREDLRSAGLVGLVQAAQSFDAERGVPYAPRPKLYPHRPYHVCLRAAA